MMKNKHNKKRNVAFIYEALINTVTTAVLNKDEPRRLKATSIIKEFYKNTEIAKEHEIYTTILECEDLAKEVAEKIIAEAKRTHDKINKEKLFTEQTPYDPRNPYSATKAAAEHFVTSWHNTYGLPYLITSSSNNYGPGQHEEKLIPKVVTNALRDEITYMHDGGEQIRDWIHVDDHCCAIWTLDQQKVLNDKFNVGGACELQNIEVTRKILDMMGSSLFNNHADLIKSYEKLMRERNILLQENKLDIGWLDTLENQMSEDGVSIALNRVNLINGLNTKLDNDQNPVWPKAFLKIDGIIEEKILFNDDKSIKNYFVEALFNNRKKDYFSGRTTFGIHKSDLMVSDRNKGIYASQCSTGEQKSLLIGLILTHLNLVAEKSNRYPILLLDEVVAHLDQLRRSALFEQIIETNAQVFMTGTELDLFQGIRNFAEIFSVGMGRLKKIN